MQYPHHLYPNRHYKLVRIDNWMQENMYVIRFTSDSEPILEESKLKNNIAQNFNKDHWINGVSVALCGPFKKNDVKYVINSKKIKSYSRPWKQGKNVRLIKPRHVLFIPNRGYFGMKINDVLNIKFNYTFEYNDAEKKKSRTDQCQLILEHEPRKNNFWHFEIWIESYNTQKCVRFTNEIGVDRLPSKRNMSKRAEAIFLRLKDIVCLPEEIQEITLPKSYYLA